MGNMSNPSINRWGMNLFWYNSWYTDKKKGLTIHLDFLINNLIQTYINFGLTQKKTFFLNKRWYFLTKTKLKEIEKITNVQYFQTMEYRSKATNENNLLRLRIQKKDLYNSKLWILRYQNWIIINLYLFQPIKTSKKNKKKINIRNINTSDLFLEKAPHIAKKFTFSLIRHKLLLSLILANKNKNNYYCF